VHAYRTTLNLLAELAGDVDHVLPSHDRWPMLPADVIAARDAYEMVLAGRQPESRHAPEGGYSGYEQHEIGPFRFMMPLGFSE